MDSEKVRGEVLDQLIEAYARRSERLLVYCRLLVASASLGNALVERYGGTPWGHADLAIALHVASLAAYLALGVAVKRTRRLLLVLSLSVILDAVVLFGFLLPGVLWAGPEHRGILRALGIGLVPLAVVAAGLRFRLRLAVLGSAMQVAALLALVAIDLSFNPEQVSYAPSHVIGFSILVVAGMVLALLIAHLTRRMVYDGAEVAVRARLAREKFRVYVSEAVARDVLDSSSDEISLDGEQRYVAVLFSDLRDFTRYATSVDPPRLVHELNAYFDAMVPAIQASGGTVDKFMGDAIMAVFAREEGGGDPGAAALAAAGAMRRALDELNQERAADRLPPLRHGIGVHVGFAVVGNVGTADRLQHTVIGDVVNVASRLEKATKELGTWLVCSRAAWDEASRAAADGLPSLAPAGRISLRGMDDAVEVYAAAPRPRYDEPGGTSE